MHKKFIFIMAMALASTTYANEEAIITDEPTLTIETLSTGALLNGSNFEFGVSLDNPADEKVHLVAALYNEETGEKVAQNYVVASESMVWESSLAVPADGAYRVELFAEHSDEIITDIIEIKDNVTFSVETRTIGQADVFAPTQIAFVEGETTWDLLLRVAESNDIVLDYSVSDWGPYLTGVNDVFAFDFGSASGWMYDVNSEAPAVGMSDNLMSGGDVIRLCYTLSWEDSIGAPLVNILQRYIDFAVDTNSSDEDLLEVIDAAQLIVTDEAYNSIDTSVEYEVNEHIAKLINILDK